MKFSIVCTVLILFSCYGKLKAVNTCGENWVTFKEEKCFRILDDTFRTYAEAEKSCAALENEPTLPIIQTKDEQDFLSDYLFKTQKKVENFWIGAQFVDNKFNWADKSDLSYTNWDKDGPRGKANYCVQIEADEGRLGKWIDEPCTKKNLVVCQKMQTWTLTRLQQTFLESTKKLINDLAEATKNIDSQKHELSEANQKITSYKQEFDNLKENIVPVGFIYTQLPDTKAPTEIWPWTNWTDVSTSYSGVFFRVEGSDAAAFGQIQHENAPRLEAVLTGGKSHTRGPFHGFDQEVVIPRIGWSDAFPTGGLWAEWMYMNLKHSSGEIRPRNMAVRIWKRIK